MAYTAHSRGGLVTFVATKVTKKAFSRKASFPHGPFRCKSVKTAGCKMLLYYSFAQTQRFCNYCYALPSHNPHYFYLISPEAVLLTGEYKKAINEPKTKERALG